MSKSIFKNKESQDISGFYYDMQKNNPMLRVTLHANTKPPVNDYVEWKPWTSKEGIKDDFPLKERTDLDIDELGTGKNPYGAMPLCSSIVNEDFNISIANNWGEFMGSQALQDTFNGVFKQLEPYSNFVGEQLGKIAESAKSYQGNNDLMKTFASGISRFAKTGSEISKGVGNVLSRSLVVQGTRFKYYGGTGISFSNLGMRFTLFADHIEEISFDKKKGIISTGKFVWRTPDDQLKNILPYSIGSYVPLASEDDAGANALLDNLKTAGLNVDSIKDAANKFLGWQMPPGGFKADIQYIDTQQKGTLMLKIGPYYKLINLVIQDIQLNYSKNIAKYYDFEKGEIKTCPLFCEVNITLSPVSKYSNEVLKKFVMSRTTIDSKHHSSKSVYNLEEEINKSIGLKK